MENGVSLGPSETNLELLVSLKWRQRRGCRLATTVFHCLRRAFVHPELCRVACGMDSLAMSLRYAAMRQPKGTCYNLR